MSQRPIEAKTGKNFHPPPLPLYAKPFNVSQNKGFALRVRLLGANAPL
jgi:hypothetical protein